MKSKKKVLHLISTLERGGSEMSHLRMLPLLGEEIESIFITLKSEGSLAPRFRDAGIKVIALNQRSPWDLSSYLRLRQTLKMVEPDLIITHLLFPDLVGRFFVQLVTPYKVIASLATTYNFPRYWIARLIERTTHYFASGYMANAESVKRTYVERFKVPTKKIKVVPTGIDIKKIQSAIPNPSLKTELGIIDTDMIIICVANLHINKGHRYLLEAFETLYHHYPNVKLLIVGQGQEEQNLKQQVLSYKAKDKIIFLGNRSDVPELLALSHIFALPTFFEGMCNAIMEAMAAGLPIVTTDIPENRELVTNQQNGILVHLKSSSALVAALTRLVSEKKIREELGMNGMKQIEERYSLEKSAAHWKQFYLSQIRA